MNTSILVGCIMILLASMLAASIITSIWIDDTFIYTIYPGARIPIAPGEYVKVQTMLSDDKLYCMRIRYYYDESDEYHESIISVGYATLKELEAELSDFLECDIKLIYKKRKSEVKYYEKRSQ